MSNAQKKRLFLMETDAFPLFALRQKPPQHYAAVHTVRPRMAKAHPLRVPLHRPDGKLGMADRLDHTIHRVLHGLKTVPKRIDCLMVRTVYGKPLAVERGEKAVRLCDRFMHLIAANILMIPLRQILHKRTAEKDVDYLQAAANAEHRLFRLRERAERIELQPIKIGIGRNASAQLLPVAGRIEIAAARQKQTVKAGRGKRLNAYGHICAELPQRIFIVFRIFRRNPKPTDGKSLPAYLCRYACKSALQPSSICA